MPFRLSLRRIALRLCVVQSIFLVAGVCAPAVFAQTGSVLISEFATRGATANAAGEFVELYNASAADVNISDWTLSYRSASGTIYGVMIAVPSGTVMPPHSFYLLAGSAWNSVPVADARWTGSGLADNGTIKLSDASGAEMDRVGFGTGNDPRGAAAPNHGETANNNSVERKATAGSTAATLCIGGSEEFAGNGYNSGDNGADFVVQTNGRNPQNSSGPPEPKSVDGSGLAAIALANMRGGGTADIPIVFKPAAGMTLAAVKIVVPGDFTWSQSAADVLIGPTLTAAIRTVGDSIFFDNPAFSADSAIITLRGITAPMRTALYTFAVFTSGGGTLRPIQGSPSLLVRGTPVSILDARRNDAAGVPELLGQFVTVNGIVTVSDQFGSPSCMQDATGGIAVYDFNFSGSVSIGDEVTITGRVTQYNGLTELTNVIIDARVSAGNQVTPIPVSIGDLLRDGVNGDETYESALVLLRNVTVNTTAWTVSGSGTNYTLSDGTDQIDIRISKNVDFVGRPAPAGSFDVTGVISQFQKTSPYVGGYQFMPRMAVDIASRGPRIISIPCETAIGSTAVTFTWRTGSSAASFMRFGRTPALEMGVAAGSASDTNAAVSVTGLEPGTIYEAIAFSVAAGDTSWSQRLYFVTASATSTGRVDVYFNKSVDNTLPIPVAAQGGVNLMYRLLDRIDSARHSIDVCLYSLSGGVGDEVAASLIAAKNRGVRVRAIFEADNAGSAAITAVRAAIPTILDDFDPINAGAGLMHNKFFIIDARDRSSDLDDYVVTGSWNCTDEGTNADAQNAVFIQDQALAAVYLREFEEMWGSDTDAPDSGVSRFGARKRNNTPHLIEVAQSRVESWFSPSDRTTDHLVRAIRSATTSLYMSIMTFTRDDIAAALIAQAGAGVTVRGVMDNQSDQGSQYQPLRSAGIDVLLKGGLAGILHHKYLIVDAESAAPDPGAYVITGSHNWTNAAESTNNENTIAIHMRPVALQYLAEWYKRYKDAGGQGVVVLRTDKCPGAPDFALGQNAPNPVTSASRMTTIPFSTSHAGHVRLALYDLLGREVAELANVFMVSGAYAVSFDASALPAGMYVYTLSTSNGALSRTLMVTR